MCVQMVKPHSGGKPSEATVVIQFGSCTGQTHKVLEYTPVTTISKC